MLRAENHTLKITLQKHTSHNLSRKLKRKDHSTNFWKEKYRKIKKDSTSRNILSLRRTIKDLKTNNKSLKRKTTAAKRKKVQLKSSTLLQKQTMNLIEQVKLKGKEISYLEDTISAMELERDDDEVPVRKDQRRGQPFAPAIREASYKLQSLGEMSMLLLLLLSRLSC